MGVVLSPKIAQVCALKATSTGFTAIRQNTKQNIQFLKQTKILVLLTLANPVIFHPSKWLLVKSTWFWVDCEKSANQIRESDYEMVCKWPVDVPWPCHLRLRLP